MVYVEDTHSSQFRIELKCNFVWEFLYTNNYKDYHKLPVSKIAELVEDDINMCNILHKDRICVHDILRKHIHLAYKKIECEKT